MTKVPMYISKEGAEELAKHEVWDNTPGIARIVPTQSDADRAAAVKQEIADRLNDLGAAMDKASAAGFEVQFQMAKQPWSGKNIIATLIIAKHY